MALDEGARPYTTADLNAAAAAAAMPAMVHAVQAVAGILSHAVRGAPAAAPPLGAATAADVVIADLPPIMVPPDAQPFLKRIKKGGQWLRLYDATDKAFHVREPLAELRAKQAAGTMTPMEAFESDNVKVVVDIARYNLRAMKQLAQLHLPVPGPNTYRSIGHVFLKNGVVQKEKLNCAPEHKDGCAVVLQLVADDLSFAGKLGERGLCLTGFALTYNLQPHGTCTYPSMRVHIDKLYGDKNAAALA